MKRFFFSAKQLKLLPKLYETEDTPIDEKMAIVKLFSPSLNWEWYVIEYDGADLCWGLVAGDENEFGYFSLSEVSYTPGLLVESDLSFEPTPIEEVLEDIAS